jgi:replicative DNA helicase
LDPPAARREKPPPPTDRQFPHNLDAERNVLGSILIRPDVCDEVALILRPADFYAPAHEKLYAHLVGLRDSGQPIDETLILERLNRSGDLADIGGTEFLASISMAVPTAANCLHYARIVKEKSICRSLIVTATNIAASGYAEEDPAEQLLDRAEEQIFAIHDLKGTAEVPSIQDVLQETFALIDHRLQHGRATGVPTGYHDLDSLMGGLHASELIILAARPSMGKTALATNIAEHVSLREQATTLFVSLEMSRLELVQRMLCSLGRINGNRFRAGRVSELDSRKLLEGAAKLGQASLFIDDQPTRNVSEIAAVARRLKRKKGGLGLVVIDYLQLIEPDNPRDPRQEQVARVARRLKGLARELKVPVLCLAQLNRQADAQGNRPKLSHLRESGAIEQDADVVMFVHREEYYMSREDRDDPANKGQLGTAEIIVGKQRNGPTGEVRLRWFDEFTRFDNMAEGFDRDQSL